MLSVLAYQSFVDDLTGEHMVDQARVRFTTIRLDHCEVKWIGSRIPNSDKGQTKVLLHYRGKKIWVYVPYGYVKDWNDFKLNLQVMCLLVYE